MLCDNRSFSLDADVIYCVVFRRNYETVGARRELSFDIYHHLFMVFGKVITTSPDLFGYLQLLHTHNLTLPYASPLIASFVGAVFSSPFPSAFFFFWPSLFPSPSFLPSALGVCCFGGGLTGFGLPFHSNFLGVI